MQSKKRKKSDSLPPKRLPELSSGQRSRLADKTMTLEERDQILRLWKVGKYRDWVFDPKRLTEIAENSEKVGRSRIYRAAISHVRKNYPEYNSLTDQELIDQGITVLFWKDTVAPKVRGKREKKARKDSDLDTFYEEEL